MYRVTVIGAGLAGCEAALQIARRGVPVRLFEMRPQKQTEAHQTGEVAELVCSNSLKSDGPENAHGLLKAELQLLGSVLLECAERARIPGGKALVVDRRRFSAEVQAALDRAGVEVVREEMTEIQALCPVPEPGPRDPDLQSPASGVKREALCVIATGPLTSQSMAEVLSALLGAERLFFYDAIAPIVAADSLDMDRIFTASRYGAGEDYLNCPMSEEEYNRFVDALLSAELHPLHEFERNGSDIAMERQSNRVEDSALDHSTTRSLDHSPVFFEGCLPIEELARRGRMTPAFGPMKPAGLFDPRAGKRPFAVVQLRRENAEGSMLNLVGFQTRLRHHEQARVFRMIPGLERAEFFRYGSMHRNTYLDGPKVLLPTLQTRVRPDLFVAGQLTGVEGYVESIGAGLVAGVSAARLAQGLEPVTLPGETMLGSLVRYVSGAVSDSSLECGGVPPLCRPEAVLPVVKAAASLPQSKASAPDLGHDPISPSGNRSCPRPAFQPMNANFGLLPGLDRRARGRERKRLLAERALAVLDAFIARPGFDSAA